MVSRAILAGYKERERESESEIESESAERERKEGREIRSGRATKVATQANSGKMPPVALAPRFFFAGHKWRLPCL